MFEQIALRLKNTPAFPQDYHPSIPMEEVGRQFCDQVYDHLQLVQDDPFLQSIYSNTPFTHKELWHEMTTRAKIINKNSKILVLHKLEAAIYLKQQGFTNVSLIIFTHLPDEAQQKFNTLTQILDIHLTIVNISHINEFIMTYNKKFDFVVGNPPFTNGSLNGAKNLYVEFFKLAESISPNVAMIMPVSFNKVKGDLKQHNARIANCIKVNIDIKTHFPSIANLEMWYVIKTENATPSVVENKISASSIPWGNIPYVDGGKLKKSISHNTFDTEFGNLTEMDNAITIYHKINGSGVFKFFIPKHSINPEFLKKLSPTSGFIVLVSQSAVKNIGFHTEIIQCSGNELFLNNLTKSVLCQTLAEAEKLVAEMKTEKFAQLIWENRNPRGDQISPTIMRTIDFGFTLNA